MLSVFFSSVFDCSRTNSNNSLSKAIFFTFSESLSGVALGEIWLRKSTSIFSMFLDRHSIILITSGSALGSGDPRLFTERVFLLLILKGFLSTSPELTDRLWTERLPDLSLNSGIFKGFFVKIAELLQFSSWD